MRRHHASRSPDSRASSAVATTPVGGWTVLLAAGLIVLATAIAFSSSFAGCFVFDDSIAIVENPTIRQLWPLWPTLYPPRQGETVTGRPLLNLSLAINFAISGYQVWSYHATNLAIHILGALLLFGVLRRTFLLPAMRNRWGTAAVPLAFVIVVLWAIHPLQTESVTYIVQRAESLMGLFYFLTLYCFIRGAEWDSTIFASAKIGTVPTIRGASVEGSGARGQGSGVRAGSSSFILPPVAWYVGSVSACLLGMATKEVMISAPLIVLLYDRTFCAGSFREAWRRRYGLYLALAGTWLLLGWLVFAMGDVRSTAESLAEEFTWWSYLWTQPGVIIHYLRLALWPSELCLDYGWPVARTAADVLLPAIVVVGLFVATVGALVQRPAWGFLGVCFFAILAPTSSFWPIGQAAFEHRMYLPLAAVAAGVVVGGFLAGQWLARRGIIPLPILQATGGTLVMFASIAFGFLTFQRNLDYQSELAIWKDTVAKVPGNGRVHLNLGNALTALGQMEGAITEYRTALEIQPNYAEAHHNFGVALYKQGHLDEAMAHYRKALQLKPDYADAHNSLGVVLARSGRFDEAIAHGNEALEIKPDFMKAHNNLGIALAKCGRFDEAIAHFQRALALKPDFAEGRDNLVIAQSQREELVKTLAKRRASLRSHPDDVALLNDLAWTLATNPNASIRNGAEAVELAQRAVRLSDGREPTVLGTLAAAYAEAGQFPEAVQTARKALQVAAQQNNPTLTESLRAKLPIYEAGTPFRTPPPVAGHTSAPP